MSRRAHIPIGLFLVGLFLVGIAAFLILKLNAGDVILSISAMGETVGSAAVIVIAAAAVSVPWRLLERYFGAFSNGPVAAALLIFLIVIAFVMRGRSFEQQIQIATQLPRCDLSVTFPSQPILKQLRTEVGGNAIEYQQASLATPTEYLRAECLPFAIDQIAAMETLKRQAIADGLENAVFEEVSSSVVKLRGYKDVVGIQSTFVVEIHRGAKSALIVLVAAKSGTFPTEGTSNFLASAR